MRNGDDSFTGYTAAEEEECEAGIEEGDYTITPCGPLGSLVHVAQEGYGHRGDLGDFADYDAALAAIKVHMERNSFFPNVWRIDDHGTADVVSF